MQDNSPYQMAAWSVYKSQPISHPKGHWFYPFAEFTRQQSDFSTPGSGLKYKNHLQYAQIPKCQKHFSFFFFVNSVQIHSVYSPSLQSLLKGCKLQTDTVRLRPHECYYEVNNPEQILAWLQTTGEEQEESATSWRVKECPTTLSTEHVKVCESMYL